MGRSRKHPVRLGPGEAEELARRAKDPATPATVRDRCLVLRELDEARAPRLTMAEVAERNRVSRTTVSECARRYAEGGLEGALSMARSANSDNARRKVDGRAEARIIATACGPAPEGHARWTVRLLAERVELDEPVSRETVRRTLKKARCDLTGRSTGACPTGPTPSS